MSDFYNMEQKEVIAHFKTDKVKGLNKKEAEKRLAREGKNVLCNNKKRSFFNRFISQFNDFMIIILLAAAAISFITSFIDGNADIAEPCIILAIVVVNALIGVIQESRAEKSLEALKKLSAPHAIVIRDGKRINIKAEDIVTGDILVLSSGDIVCADCRIIDSNALICDESALTGESVPVEKDFNAFVPSDTPIGDRKNMLFSSTSIMGGKCTAVVTATGMNTETGHIAKLLIDNAPMKTPLQKKLSDTGKALGSGALIICAVIFVIGIMRHLPVFEMFMTSVSLAVAAIPEGLPAIVTIMLAIGLMRMSDKNAVIRNLPSVETLGGASVICTDKTGTLTQNKMKVTTTFSDDDSFMFRLAFMCSDGENPTDCAIISECKKRNIDSIKFRKIDEIPFDSTRKRMTVLCKDIKGGRTIVKGAIDYILPLCTHEMKSGKPVSISMSSKKRILSKNDEMTSSALRVIAVAYCDCQNSISEKNLTFAGLLGIEDPPRPEAKKAVEVCKEAGIRPVMITGDHAGTALSIAKQTGIVDQYCKNVLTGTQLDLMSEEELSKRINDYSVFARVSPAHKLMIVKAFQKHGETVAMTGDGVNDAPALLAADIGCSMGISGTEVAKSASDMVLTDDNFATIVYAVREGRGIFENIKKAVKFLLSSNIGEILTVFSGIIFGCSSPLTAIELLWVNLVTDSLPAIALGLDPSDESIMKRPPRPKNKGLFADGLWFSIIFEGLMIGALALLAFSVGKNVFLDETVGRTMSFAVLSMSQLVHAFNMRSEESVFKAGIFKNPYLILSFLVGVFLEVSVITAPQIADIFEVVPLSVFQWGCVGGLSIMPLIIVEIQKLFSDIMKK